MILRIVRMEFSAETLPLFTELFDQHKNAIRKVNGCQHLALHQDAQKPYVRYTYSYWDSQKELDAYRHSKLFGLVWPKTKQLFAAPPQAFSLLHLENVEPRQG